MGVLNLIARTSQVMHRARPKAGTSARWAWDHFAQSGPVKDLRLLDGAWTCERPNGELEAVEAWRIYRERTGLGMKGSAHLREAEKARKRMQTCLDKLNERLVTLLDESVASIIYQHGDGWCVLFDDDHNAPVASMDIDKLLDMGRDEALKYLRARSI